MESSASPEEPKIPAAAAPAGPPAGGPVAPLPAASAGAPAPPVSVLRLYRRASVLALVRQPLHSWMVPFLLLLPFSILDAVLPEPHVIFRDARLFLIYAVGGLLGLVMTLIISAMLRVRCVAEAAGRRVHGLDAYARGVERLGVLLVTEIVRTLAIGAAAVFLVIPGVVLSQRLSVATESVVLGEPSLASGFQQSFALTRRRFGSWVRMVLAALLALFVVFAGAVFAYAVLVLFGLELAASLAVAPFAAACLAVVQYAWTYYYLELGGVARLAGVEPSAAGQDLEPPLQPAATPVAPETMAAPEPPAARAETVCAHYGENPRAARADGAIA